MNPAVVSLKGYAHVNRELLTSVSAFQLHFKISVYSKLSRRLSRQHLCKRYLRELSRKILSLFYLFLRVEILTSRLLSGFTAGWRVETGPIKATRCASLRLRWVRERELLLLTHPDHSQRLPALNRAPSILLPGLGDVRRTRMTSPRDWPQERIEAKTRPVHPQPYSGWPEELVSAPHAENDQAMRRLGLPAKIRSMDGSDSGLIAVLRRRHFRPVARNPLRWVQWGLDVAVSWGSKPIQCA